MSEKIYARVVNGKIIDYPVYEYIIYGKGDSFSLYTPVDTSDKPEEDEFIDVSEEAVYLADKKIVKVYYTVTPKSIDYLFEKINRKVPNPEDPTNEEKMTLCELTPQDIAKVEEMVVAKIDEELQRLATERKYDNINTLVSYMNSSDDKFKNEAIYANDIRDGVYRNLYTYLGQVLTNQKPRPTSWENLVQEAGLPAISWENFDKQS